MSDRRVANNGERLDSPIKLGNYVSRMSGSSVEEILCAAEDATEALSHEFRDLVKDELAQLRDARDRQSIRKIFEISHELRGLAGSFDLPLLTQVGTSLCDFVDRVEDPSALCQKVINLHIATMFQIVANNMTGNADETGQRLLDGLLAARAKAERTRARPNDAALGAGMTLAPAHPDGSFRLSMGFRTGSR